MGYAENCKIGFDLWQVKSGTIFDNMMITDDPAEAKAAGEALWAVTKEAEMKRRGPRLRLRLERRETTRMMRISTTSMKMRRMRSRTETTRTQRVTTSYEVVRALFYRAFAGAVRDMVPASAGSYLCRILGTHQRVSGHSQVNFIQRLLV